MDRSGGIVTSSKFLYDLWNALVGIRFISSFFLMFTPVMAQDCRVLLQRVQQLDEQKNYRNSAQVLENAVHVCPHTQEVLLNLTKRRLLAQQIPEAQQAVSRLLRENPANLEGLKLKSDIYYLAGDDGAAEEALKQILSIYPAHEEAIYSLGRLYYQQARYQAACDQFHKTLSLNPKSYKAYDNLGLCYEGLQDISKATQNYLKSIELVHQAHPKYDWPFANLANLLINQGDARKAFDLAAEAAERNPESARNFYLGGKALRELNQVDQSIRWLKRSIELNPAYPEPYYLLGIIYRDQKNSEGSQLALQKFRELRMKAPRDLR